MWLDVCLIAGGLLVLLFVSPFRFGLPDSGTNPSGERDPERMPNRAVGVVVGGTAVVYGIGSLLT
jgi:hypothetical protein